MVSVLGALFTGGGASSNRLANTIQLICESAVPRNQHDSRGGRQEFARLIGDQIGTKHEHGSAHAVRCGPRTRLAHARQSLERVLQILNVGRRTVVQKYQIRRKALHLPVLMRLQQLASNGDIFHGVDSQEQDRDIA